jgi:hypothetical protein
MWSKKEAAFRKIVGVSGKVGEIRGGDEGAQLITMID